MLYTALSTDWLSSTLESGGRPQIDGDVQIKDPHCLRTEEEAIMENFTRERVGFNQQSAYIECFQTTFERS